MRLLTLICARKGSKGIAGKNIRALAGKPLIAWTIDLAKLCPSVGRIVVSTDGEEIAEVARRHGADVPFLRPAELARDDTLQIDAIRHAVLEVERQGAHYDAILLLQPTAPLRRVEDVEGCIGMMRETECGHGRLSRQDRGRRARNILLAQRGRASWLPTRLRPRRARCARSSRRYTPAAAPFI